MESVCQSHRKKEKLYCETCELPLCWKCVPSHPNHTIDSLQAILESSIRQLEGILGILGSSDDELLLTKASEISSFLASLQPGETLSSYFSVQSQIHQAKSSLDDRLPFCKGLTVEKLLEKEGKERPYLHWVEWNESYLHLMDLTSLVRTCQTIPSSRVFPLFSRTIAIPSKRLLVCGGREEPGKPELSAAWILHIDSVLKVQDIDPMITGRSNHSIVVVDNIVYALSGCAKNTATKECEKLYLSTLKWESIADSIEYHDAGSACNHGDSIYLCGGRNVDAVSISLIEKYSIQEDNWTLLNVQIPFAAHLSGTIIIPQNPAHLLIISGHDSQKAPVNQCAIVDVQQQSQVENFELHTRGGSIVDKVVAHEGQVYFYILREYCSRFLEAWNIHTRQWTSVAKS